MPGAGRAPVQWGAMRSFNSPFESLSGLNSSSDVFTSYGYIHRRRSSVGMDEQNKCILCKDEPIGFNYPTSTFRFNCGHAFCIFCTREGLEQYILDTDVNNVKCFHDRCPTRATIDQLEMLYLDEPIILEKLNDFED